MYLYGFWKNTFCGNRFVVLVLDVTSPLCPYGALLQRRDCFYISCLHIPRRKFDLMQRRGNWKWVPLPGFLFVQIQLDLAKHWYLYIRIERIETPQTHVVEFTLYSQVEGAVAYFYSPVRRLIWISNRILSSELTTSSELFLVRFCKLKSSTWSNLNWKVPATVVLCGCWQASFLRHFESFFMTNTGLRKIVSSIFDPEFSVLNPLHGSEVQNRTQVELEGCLSSNAV